MFLEVTVLGFPAPSEVLVSMVLTPLPTQTWTLTKKNATREVLDAQSLPPFLSTLGCQLSLVPFDQLLSHLQGPFLEQCMDPKSILPCIRSPLASSEEASLQPGGQRCEGPVLMGAQPWSPLHSTHCP